MLRGHHHRRPRADDGDDVDVVARGRGVRRRSRVGDLVVRAPPEIAHVNIRIVDFRSGGRASGDNIDRGVAGVQRQIIAVTLIGGRSRWLLVNDSPGESG